MKDFSLVIEELQVRAEGTNNPHLKEALEKVIALLKHLDQRGLAPQAFSNELATLKKQLACDTKPSQIRAFYNMLTDRLRKKHGLTVPHFYRNLWMGIGMGVFGVPLGTVFSSLLNNFAFVGIGIPVGMSIGMAIGIQKDHQALAEGRQLNI
ncbi:MAG: hypothetical protein VYB44_11505 [Bacteroidota bacterium]|nr:hypothetical protein [Bacteroidota bacterium]